jgi:hypothetical protein
MKKIFILIGLFFVFAIGASAQTACPADKVCITPDSAKYYLQLDDLNKALKQENAAVKQENVALKDANNVTKQELTNTQIELAKTTGENTALKSTAVRMDAIVDVLIKQARPKKIGLINLF